MLPSINGISIKIYKVDDTAEKHEFRERLKYRDQNYVLLKKTKAQPRFFSAEEMRFKEELLKFSSLGYFIFKSSTLKKLGISPAPNGKNWVDYRLSPYINGSYSTELLSIVEIRPESPWHSQFTLWYLYFTDVLKEPVVDTVTSPVEERDIDNIQNVVDVVREY